MTSKTGRLRKTAHEYPRVFRGVFGQVRDFIVLEASTLGNFEPYSEMDVSTFLYDMMKERGQHDLIDQYGLEPVELKVLDLKRTLCEKIMSLVRFSYDPDPIFSLRNKIRHTYDIYSLLQLDEMNSFFESPEYDAMLVKVGKDDVDSFRNNNEWLRHHPKEALIFKKVEETWEQLKSTYNEEFANLVFGELPAESLVKGVLQLISQRIRAVDWVVEF